MGLVYLAHDPKIDRKVAIKTIQRNPSVQESEAEESRQRFLREAQAAGKLIHPGIVTIFDVGDDQGFSYIAMEYIEGDTLEAATKPDHLLPVEMVVRMVIQGCNALDYAHEHKIVHRDIKPANLMVIAGKQLKVTDFGLAKNPSANLTSAGTLVGTPNYMSPEQIMGRALDGRSDLFSMGVVLYELLTGDRPFGGDTISTIIYKILHEIPKSPEAVNPRVPAALTQVILKAIDKDPAKRFQAGHEFAASLQAYLDSVSPPMLSAQLRASAVREPAPPTVAEIPAGVAAPPPPSATRGARPAAARPAPAPPVRRRRSLALPITLGLLIAAAAAGVVLYPRLAPLLGLQAPASPPTNPGDASGNGASKAHGGVTPPALPDVSVPGALPREVTSIRVETEPPGGRIFLDDAEVTGGTILLPKDDNSSHELRAANDCFEDQKAVRSSGPDSLVIPLKTPRLHKVRITSAPPGARISVDGREIPLQAPADSNVTYCEAHTITARLSGFRDSKREFGADTVWAGAPPVHFSMEKLPDGMVVVTGPYPLEVMEADRQIGASGVPISLPAGRHTLRLVNREFFVSVSTEVDVRAGERVSPSATLPGLGKLDIFANPGNGTVSIEGRKIGPLPINGYQISEGLHEVKVTLDSGQSEVRSVLVQSGGNPPVKIIFKKE